MTSRQPYTEEFKIEAAKQIKERHNRVADVSAPIGAEHVKVVVAPSMQLSAAYPMPPLPHDRATRCAWD
jgi:hypothetical protein